MSEGYSVRYQYNQQEIEIFKAKPLRVVHWDTQDRVMIFNPKRIKRDFVGTRFIPLQDTGVADKNGKQIYEGDFIRLNWHHQPEDEPAVKVRVVKWDFDHQGFFPFIDFCMSLTRIIDYNSIEIIGNVFQNPELYEQVTR